ncbi:hypothetical protein J6590_086233 [Homalodisca vitripennis]|nr:hypothetical protein J6590_086233 [Homalodisca vitripennis]
MSLSGANKIKDVREQFPARVDSLTRCCCHFTPAYLYPVGICPGVIRVAKNTNKRGSDHDGTNWLHTLNRP